MSTDHGGRRGGGSIARLLGEHSATGGPFALLRLTPDTCTDDSIIAGLDTQLTVLAAHPECDTPEADEVRLALHAAAAQLLDAKVRAYLIANWRESHPGAATKPAPLPPPISRPVARIPRAQIALEHDAILTLGLYGGWNKRSLRRLVSLAHARGMDAAQVARTVNALSSRRRGVSRAPAETQRRPAPSAQPVASASPTRTTPEPSANAHADQRKSGPDLRVLGLAIGIIAAMAFVAVAIGLIVMVTNAGKNDTGAQLTPLTETHAGNTSPSKLLQPQAITNSSNESTNKPGLITLTERAAASPGSIARATKALSVDPDGALEAFEHAVYALQNAWPRIPADTHVAAQHEVIEFMYRSSVNPAINERALNSLIRGIESLKPGGLVTQDALWSAIWSAGMLTRLSSESDLSGTLRQRIAGEVIGALRERRVVQRPTFRAGALAALDSLADAYSPDTRPLFPWEQWADAAFALSNSNPKAREALMLDALQIVLLEGGEPNDDKGTFDAVRLLTHRVPWRGGDESRRRLLAWFLDDRVTNADLHAVTTALARESSASGVDVTMVLPVMSSDEVRQQLRGRYATAWGMTGGIDKRTVTAELASTARDVLVGLPGNSRPSEFLAQTVRLSRVSEAISWAWRGRSQEADELLAGIEDNLDHSPSSTAISNTAAFDQSTPRDAGSGTSWAARYLAAKKRAAVRIDLLDQLETMAIPDAVAAELLVRDALRGTPALVRRRAREVVLVHSSDAAVANAVLEQLPTIPRTHDNALLIESITFSVLPDVSDDEWPFRARRELVEHLLDILSTDGEYAAVDEYVNQLTITYVGRSSRTPLVGSDRDSAASTDTAVAASLLFRQWRSGLDRALANRNASISADAADRLRTGRLELASGPIQQFAANQASICEIMGIVIEGEQPAAATRIHSIIADMTIDRRRAGSAFEQVFAVEQAMLKLWLIRIGEQDA